MMAAERAGADGEEGLRWRAPSLAGVKQHDVADQRRPRAAAGVGQCCLLPTRRPRSAPSSRVRAPHRAHARKATASAGAPSTDASSGTNRGPFDGPSSSAPHCGSGLVAASAATPRARSTSQTAMRVRSTPLRDEEMTGYQLARWSSLKSENASSKVNNPEAALSRALIRNVYIEWASPRPSRVEPASPPVEALEVSLPLPASRAASRRRRRSFLRCCSDRPGGRHDPAPVGHHDVDALCP